MLARLRTLLLCTLVTALAPLATPPAVGPAYPVVHEHDGPAVSADHGPFSLALRGEERVELATTEHRPTETGVGDPFLTQSAEYPPLLGASTQWCDHVQCRRLAGAQLLHFATPPPARG